MANVIHEPNQILEINEAHADNFILVIPKLPTSVFIGSVFNEITHSYGYTSNTTGATGNPSDNQCVTANKSQIVRESNLDITNYKLFIKSFSTPAINIVDYAIDSHFASIKRAGKIQFSDLSTTLMISENFLNYRILLYWLYALHNPQEYNKISGHDMIEQYFTDIYLIITNNHREKVCEFKFLDAFPKTLPGINFTWENAENLFVDVAWAHSGMYPTDNFVLKYV